jgi:Flp pilus assembly protein TadG
MGGKTQTRARRQKGQSAIETALLLPLFLMLAFNAINFGYFFFVMLNLAAAPRQAVLYSAQGGATPRSPDVPAAGPQGTSTTVSSLAYSDISGAIASAANTPLQVCSKAVGVTIPGGDATKQAATCTTYNAGEVTFPTADVDPEAPAFVLHRVDITYTVTPPVPGRLFNLILPSNLAFHRQVEMRAMD